MIVKKTGDWLAGAVGGQTLMMSMSKGTYIGLSKVGSAIWELIETPMDVETICARLRSRFDVSPEVCRAEVEDFLAEMQKHGAVAFEPSP